MKRTIFTIILLNLAYLINAQEKTLKELIAEGNKTYVEFIDVRRTFRKPKTPSILLSKEKSGTVGLW